MKNFIKFFSYPIVIFSFIPLNHSSFLRSQEKNSFNFIDINEFHKSDTYLIGPGDLLNINFIGYEELSGDFEVMNDGNINLPLINMVYLRNLSTHFLIIHILLSQLMKSQTSYSPLLLSELLNFY